MELLFASPRQEGMWDGVLTARIGKWMTNCEEDDLEPPSSLNSSRQSSVSNASLASSRGESRASGGRFSYPSPPPVDDKSGIGGWEDGRKISDVVNEAVGKSEDHLVSSTASSPKGGTSSGRRKKSVVKAKEAKGKQTARRGWMVPEENRVRLMVVDFHIPERYIKVKCQKALPGRDGKREERETVIAW